MTSRVRKWRLAQWMPGWAPILCLAFLLVFVAYPVVLLLLQSIAPDLLAGQFTITWRAYAAIFTTQGIPEMLYNSLRWAGMTTIFSWCMGVPCGWILARVPMRSTAIIRLVLLIPIMTPPYVLALSYTLLMLPGGLGDVMLTTVGGVPELLRSVFFSFWGISFVMAVCSFGYVALAVETSLRVLPTRLEHAASILGASRIANMRLIVFPLLLPALLNGGLLVFLDALSNFGVPAIMGPRANLPLLPAEIYALVTSWPLDFPLATALSSLLVFFAILTLLINQRLMQHSTRHGTARSSPTTTTPPTSITRMLCWGFLAFMFLVCIVLPFAGMLLSSVVKRWNVEASARPQFTLDHYVLLLTPGSRGLAALWTSFWLSAVAATICTIMGAFIAYTIARHQGVLARVLDAIAILPRVLPKIVMAVALIMAWNAPWMNLPGIRVYGTVWILLIAYIALYLSDALRFGDTGMRNINPRLEHAAASLGATPARTFGSITLPLLWPSLLAGWLTTFIACMRDLVASVILLPPGVDTVGSFIFNQFEQGDAAIAMAMATLLVFIVLAVLLPAQHLARRLR